MSSSARELNEKFIAKLCCAHFAVVVFVCWFASKGYNNAFPVEGVAKHKKDTKKNDFQCLCEESSILFCFAWAVFCV